MPRQQDYYTTVYNTARSLGANDVQAHLAASQASLETGYGRSVKGNNHFGIKAGSKYKGNTVSFGTHEFSGGRKVSQRDTFRAYEGLPGSIKGYMEFMQRNYPAAWEAPTVPQAASNLDKGRYGGYATDPKYEQKVKSIASRRGAAVNTAQLPDTAPIPTPAPSRTSVAPASQVARAEVESPMLAAYAPPAERAAGGIFAPIVGSANAAPVTAPAGRRTVYPEGEPVAISKPHVEGTEIGPEGIESPLLEPPSPFRPDNLPQHYQGPKGLGGPGGLYPGGVPKEPGLLEPEPALPVAEVPEKAGRLGTPSPLPDEQFNARFGAAPEPAVPSGMHAISGLFGSPQGAMATSRSNPDITFRSLGNGMVEKTNQYGARSIMDAGDYAHPEVPGPQIAGPVGQPVQPPPQPEDGFMGVPRTQTRLGETVRGGLGGAAGAGLGGLLGPAGALLGGLLGRELARGNNPLQAFSRQPTNAFASMNPNMFPATPPAPVQMGSSNSPSFAEMSAISPRAASAISSGRTGLF